MSKELMIERIEKAQKEIEAKKREKIQQGKISPDYFILWQKLDGSMTQMG